MFELKKIGIVKRASAWLLDAILLAVLATGVMWIVSLICGYEDASTLSRQYFKEWDDYRVAYMADVAEYYGFTYTEDEEGQYTVTKDGEPASLNDVMTKLDASKGNDEATKEAYEAYRKLPPVDKLDAQYQYVNSMLFMMISIGLLLSFLVFEFILPLIFGNGQTIGKKVFGIGLVRPNGVKVTSVAVFARMLLGKFAIETMFPILLVFLFFFGGLGLLAVILLGALLILNLVLFIATKNHTPIHDVIAYTVAVDIKLQVVFDSEEELAEKKALATKERIEHERNV